MTSNQGKLLATIFAIIVIAGAIFVGLQQLSQWHEKEIQSALELQRKQYEKNYAELKREIQQLEEQQAHLEEQLEEQLKEKKPAKVSEERVTEVFGKPEEETENRCDLLEKRISSFFDYIDKEIPGEQDSRELFFQMTAELAESPPKVVGETRDLITLLRNRAHFFRVLKKERIDMVRHILKTEKDILEHTMADFYAYYIGEDRCINEDDKELMPMAALYDYAGFFLETIAGKSYLMRRESTTRNLSLYYSILVLDRAIEKGLNKYGIDIRDHIDYAIDDIRSLADLAYQDRYLDTLEKLQEKYEH